VTPPVNISQHVTPKDHCRAEIEGRRMENIIEVKEGKECFSHHITPFGEYSITDAFWGHPLHWQLHTSINHLPYVCLRVQLFRKPKVGNFDHCVFSKPVVITHIIGK